LTGRAGRCRCSEELQHVADDGSGDDLVLIAGEPRLLVEIVEHRSP
jgi:hypothetical protein